MKALLSILTLGLFLVAPNCMAQKQISLQAGTNIPLSALGEVYDPGIGFSAGYHNRLRDQVTYDIKATYVKFEPMATPLFFERSPSTGVLSNEDVLGSFSDFETTRLTVGLNYWLLPGKPAVRPYTGLEAGLTLVAYDVGSVDLGRVETDKLNIGQGFVALRAGVAFRISSTVNLFSELRYNAHIEYGDQDASVAPDLPALGEASFLALDFGVAYQL